MPQYKKHSTYQDRKRDLLKKRIRFVILLVLILILVAVGVKLIADRKGATPNQPSPSPSAVAAEPSASPSSTPQPELQTDLLKSLENHDGVKTAYLTFDDGPTKSITPRILDTLRRYNIKATFFQLGTQIEANPDMARRVYDEGHLLANHSYTHDYRKLYAAEDAFISEVNKTDGLITDITGEEDYFRLFRYPGGSYPAGTWGANKQKYKETLKNNGYYYCDWNALNGDAEGGTKTKDQLVERIKTTTKDKEDVVILMHDAAAKKTTAEALSDVIDYLISQGYEFARMDGEK